MSLEEEESSYTDYVEAIFNEMENELSVFPDSLTEEQAEEMSQTVKDSTKSAKQKLINFGDKVSSETSKLTPEQKKQVKGFFDAAKSAISYVAEKLLVFLNKVYSKSSDILANKVAESIADAVSKVFKEALKRIGFS